MCCVEKGTIPIQLWSVQNAHCFASLILGLPSAIQSFWGLMCLIGSSMILTLTLLLRCRFEVLVAISCVSWLLVEAQLLVIPLAPISVFFFSFKLQVQSSLFVVGDMMSTATVKMVM